MIDFQILHSRVIKLLAAAALSFCNSVRAAEGDTGTVFLDMVAVIQVAAGGHLPGNLEVRVRGGFTLPAGMTCSNLYITTLKSTDADQRMFKLLSMAQMLGKPVRLRITDDQTLKAFDGRCSLIWVAVDS